MSDWNPELYLMFKKERTQPAVDLAARVLNSEPKTVVDIGCGAGNSTRVLKNTFPNADILGIDSSPNMISAALRDNPDIRFKLCDASSLDGEYDLLFSNACLQWLPNHSELFPRLMQRLSRGGTLAVQMPINNEEPLFKIIKEVASEPKWGLCKVLAEETEALEPQEYYRIFAGCSSDFNIWTTTYYHSLPNHIALTQWVKGSRLRPYLDLLGEERGREFEEEIIERTRSLYPVMPDGRVILGFRRLFITAKR